MLSFEEAKSAILRAVPMVGTEIIPVREALGRVLAEELTVPRDYPDTRLSAVDGYALRFGSGSRFQQVAVVAAGQVPEFALEPGQCAAIMTGATVPNETDCVVMVEDCEEQDGIVEVLKGLEQGDLIEEPAAEAVAGAQLVGPGMRISRSVYPALFYAGISNVRVYRRPLAGVVVTGDELREVEAGPAKARVFNTNRYIVESFFDSIGVDFVLARRVADEEEATRQTLEDMADKCDFIISSGGVSMGRFDCVKKILLETHFELLVQRTAIKPGRPLMVAKHGGKLFFGMPGYPAAFLTNALLYLIPALKKAGGRNDYEHRWLKARLTTRMRSRKGKIYLNRAVLELREGEWTARDPGSQKTSHFLNFTDVNGLVLIPEAVGTLDVGAEVQALHFDIELT